MKSREIRAKGWRSRERSDDGDTLVEVLLAVTILAIASVALIIAFGTSIKASAEHRNLTNFDLVLTSSSSTVSTVLQESANASTFFGQCQSLSVYQSALAKYEASGLAPKLPSNFTVSITSVSWWNGSSFIPYTVPLACNSGDWNAPQEITFQVKNGLTGISQTSQVVVDNPATLQAFATASTGTAAQLQFTTQPSGATINTPFAVQPVIEVENSAGQLVTSDLSPVTMTLTGTGPTGASLSNTCSGVETSGVITFSNCSINEIGSGFTLTATDGNLPSVTSSAFTVAATQLATPVITNVSSSTATAGAINVTFAGSTNAPTVQTYNVKACQNSAMSLNCVTQTNYVSGTDVTGLASGANYYVQITATASTGYLPATTQPNGPTPATIQLATPTAPSANYGPSAGSLIVTLTGSSNAPAGQTYTATACTNSAMTAGCISVDTATYSTIITGLAFAAGTAGSTYYVETSADASPGYLQSLPSASGQHADTSQVPTPSAVTVSSSASQAGAIAVSFSEPSGTYAPASFTAVACPSGSTNGCVTQTNYTSGAQLTGLTAGVNYGVTLTAVSTNAAYASATASLAGPALATLQLATPSGASVSYGTVAGSISVNFSEAAPIASGQTYTATACTNSAMTAGCISNASYVAGSDLSGLAYTAGSVGTTYYVKVVANPSSGYLASLPSSQVSGPETSQLGAPGVPSVSPSASAGGLVATFSSSSGIVPASYSATACTNASMTIGCVVQTNYVSGTPLTGLVQGTSYYVTITAIPSSAAYVSNVTAPSAPAVATVQLAAPSSVSVGYGTAAGSLVVNFSESSPYASGQTYTLKACTNTAMSTGCVTNASYTSGSNVTGLPFTAGSAGTTYYVTVVANGTTGYLVSPPSGQVSGSETSQIATPGTPSAVSSTTNAGAIVATIVAPSGITPSSYTVTACTNTLMTAGCVTQSNYTSGSQFTGLVVGSSYYVSVVGVGPAGYVPSAASVHSVSAAVATAQLGTPVVSGAASSSTTAGAVTISFAAGTPVAPSQTYTATACTNSSMSTGCVSRANYTTGSQFTGLVAGTSYYVSITANASAGYIQATTVNATPVFATVQLSTPTTVSVSYGTSAGSVYVLFSMSLPVANGQTYTAKACTNPGMTSGCVTNSTYSEGTNLTGLTYTPGMAGATYYVTVTANASAGYLASGTSAQASGSELSQIATPGTPTAATSTTTTGAIVVTFASSSGQAPASYTVTACTDTLMTAGCMTKTSYVSGVTQFTGLASGTYYYVDITGVGLTGYATSATSAVSVASTKAK
jgi:hypothetical protein